MASPWMDSLTRELQALGEQGYSEKEITEAAPMILAEIQKMSGQAGPYRSGYGMPAKDDPNAAPGPVTPENMTATQQLLRARDMEKKRALFLEMASRGVALPQGVQEQFLSTEEDRDKAATANATNLVGLAAGAGAGAVLAPVVRGATAAAPWLAPAARVGAGVAEGAVSGGAAGAADSGMHGENIVDGALEGAKTGAKFGGAVAGAGEVLRGGTKLVRGLDRWIKRAGEAADRGYYTSADAMEIPGGNEGMRKASERGLQRVIDREAELQGAASSRYRATVEPQLSRPVDPYEITGPIHEARAASINPNTGNPYNKRITERLTGAIDETHAGAPTVEGTLGRRRTLKREAGFGAPAPTEEQLAAQDTYQALRAGIRRASPEVAAADDAYAAHAKARDRRSDILFNAEENVIARPGDLPEVTPPVEYADEVFEAGGRPRVNKERSGATFLSRVGDDNQPGLVAQRYIEELGFSDPKIKAAIDEIADIKARELTRLSLKGLGATDLQGAVQGAGLWRTLGQNVRGLGAGADTAMSLGAQAAPTAVKLNPIQVARHKERERDRERAERLKRGSNRP